MQGLVAKIHYTKRFLYNRVTIILQNTYLHCVCIYKKAWIIPEATASTRERWCSVRAGRTAPGCGWLWGVGVRWCAAGANVEETKSSHGQECASVLRRCVCGGSEAEEVVAKPGAHSPLKAPSGFCSCCWWTGWSSAGRTSCLHHRPPGWGGLVSAARWPPDPSSPSPSSKSGSHSPESLPFPPLDSSSSKRIKALMFAHQRCWKCGVLVYHIICVFQHQQSQRLQVVVNSLPSAFLHLRFGELSDGKFWLEARSTFHALMLQAVKDLTLLPVRRPEAPEDKAFMLGNACLLTGISKQTGAFELTSLVLTSRAQATPSGHAPTHRDARCLDNSRKWMLLFCRPEHNGDDVRASLCL